MQPLWQDLRYAVRMLAKNPGFLAIAVLTLAMAIGANGVVFSVLKALILHPLHVPNSDTLYAIQHGNQASLYQSYPDYLDLRDRNHSFEDLGAFNIDQAGIDTGENPSRIWLAEVSGNYFDLLGVQPYLGRLFHTPDEQGPNSAPYVVLGYSYWHTHFQDDRSVVGRVVQLSRHPFTIVGVAPPEFHGTLVFFDADLFVPIVNGPQLNDGNDLQARGNRWVFMTLGHLKPGVSRAQAIADLNSIGSYLEKTYPKEDAQRTFALARPSLYGDYLGRPMQAFMTGLMLLACLILVAACANLGGLFAARAADRSRELALRLALGASRLRVLRQLFTEAGLLSFLGGALGIWGSVVLLGSLSMWQPASKWPELRVPVNPDANVYGFSVLLTVVSGLMFGAVPIRQVLHTDPYQIVKSGSLAQLGPRITIRDLLLGIQIAICAVLITSSMVAVRGLVRSLHSDFGFKPQNALLVDTDVNLAGYRDDSVPQMQQRMIDVLAEIRGVRSVGLIDSTPLVAGGYNVSPVFTEGVTDLRPSNAAAQSFVFSISPDYFGAAGTTLLKGRNFTRHDDQDAPRVAAINEFFARKVFGSPVSAIGRYFKNREGTRIQVVAIVENGKYQHLTEDAQPAMFLPILQAPTSSTWLVVRSDFDSRQMSSAVRQSLRRLDAGLPVYVDTWSKGLELSLFPARMAAISLGLMGVMGAMLSVTGIFGMAAYSVSKRLRELGIRMALGAQRKEVLQSALGRSFRLLALGSGVGLLLGILASRVLTFIVYQATPRDPLVLAGVVVAMGLLGLVATWIPAQRALSINPAMLMREE
jgi:predicted permease